MQGGGLAGKRRGRGGGGDEDDAGPASPPNNKPDSTYLIIRSGRGRASDYRKGDLWIVSNNPTFQAGLGPGQPGDRSRAPWAAVARSLWHGPNQDGK